MENLFVIYALVAALCAPFLGIHVFVRQRRARRREQALAQEVARLERLTAEQLKQFNYTQLLESLRAGQQSLTEALLRAGENEAEDRRELVQEFSKVAQAMDNLTESMEAKTPSTDTLTMPVVQDWLADLPTEPEARLAALERRRSVLWAAIRKCNDALGEAHRELRTVNPGTQEPSIQIMVEEVPERESFTPAETADQPADAPRDAYEEVTEPESFTPVETVGQTADSQVDAPETLSSADLAHILQEDHERELLRLILRDDGRPDDDSIRLVLGERFYHWVLDDINERAQQVLDDVLLYEEEDRLVVTEEFVDDLITFLNDRAIPSRRV